MCAYSEIQTGFSEIKSLSIQDPFEGEGDKVATFVVNNIYNCSVVFGNRINHQNPRDHISVHIMN